MWRPGFGTLPLPLPPCVRWVCHFLLGVPQDNCDWSSLWGRWNSQVPTHACVPHWLSPAPPCLTGVADRACLVSCPANLEWLRTHWKVPTPGFEAFEGAEGAKLTLFKCRGWRRAVGPRVPGGCPSTSSDISSHRPFPTLAPPLPRHPDTLLLDWWVLPTGDVGVQTPALRLLSHSGLPFVKWGSASLCESLLNKPSTHSMTLWLPCPHSGPGVPALHEKGRSRAAGGHEDAGRQTGCLHASRTEAFKGLLGLCAGMGGTITANTSHSINIPFSKCFLGPLC